MSWNIKTELVGTEPEDKNLPDGDKTELTKITAIHVETGNAYQLKCRMGTAEYRKAAWDNIWQQHLERIKVVADVLADEGKTELERKEAL